MKNRVFALSLVAVLVALPLLATSPPDIPAGNDVWDTPAGGGTNTVLTSADWLALCGVSVGDTAVQFKGFNISGFGTGDAVVQRLSNASLPTVGSSATVNIQLFDLSLVNDGPHPCSPNTLRVRKFGTQAIGTMSITRTSTAGGSFSATVPVTAKVEAVNSSGTVIGSTIVNGSLIDPSGSPWSYAPPTAGAPQPGPWYPGVNPATGQPVRVCRYGNKTMPAQHCYWPAPKCPTANPNPTPSPDPTPLPGEPVGTVGKTTSDRTDTATDTSATLAVAEPCLLSATATQGTVQ